jgi:hypothetical protein
VIAAVAAAKARSLAALDAVNSTIDAMNRIAELGTIPAYTCVFQQMGLLPRDDDDDCYGDLSIARAHTAFEDKVIQLEQMRTNNLRAHCQDGLNRRFGDDVAKLVGDVNNRYTLRVYCGSKAKRWATCARLPKLPLMEWRERLKDADVADEVRRLVSAC